MDLKDKSVEEIAQMIGPRGIPVYEDSTMPHGDPETGDDVHARLLKMPGKPLVLLCSRQFLLQLKDKYGG